MSAATTGRVRLSFGETLKILGPYFYENLLEQLRAVWFIVAYLLLFQILILGLPIVHAVMIGVGIAIVALGLMFFMEGLRLGLMPLGETIGAILPRNSSLPVILLFAFLLGLGATFAEPAIAVLRSAGAGVQPQQMPLLYSLLNDFPDQLVTVVGIGVGVAVMLGILRFFLGWSLKSLVLPLVVLLCAMTLYAHSNDILQPVLGLAWDCGAVTTGPVTVPLVLALGIGVCRIVGDGDSGNAGFGIVTLASLFPILAVLLLGIWHVQQDDYYGRPGYTGTAAVIEAQASPAQPRASTEPDGFSAEEFRRFLRNGTPPSDYRLRFEGGHSELVDGRIVVDGASLVLEKRQLLQAKVVSRATWDPQVRLLQELRDGAVIALRAIVPLCLFLLVTLRLVLPERLRNRDEIFIGVLFALVGMSLFMLGMTLGLTPLGTQLGSNVPLSFATLTPWGAEGLREPLFASQTAGKVLAAVFGFFLGYGATLAEPALNALGGTVEKITVGAFKKSLLMQSVALGVGAGIAVGVVKIAFDIPLEYLLIPPYVVLLLLTAMSSEEFVNFGWDSAGVTTGPITVPLVLAMGLGIGANVPGVSDGFGILALASVGPILTVLGVGLLVSRSRREEAAAVRAA
ncbi:MAG: DUF1538 domain-containing protein [Nevskiales bacterium]|nr:DUF1538 domain-containing protein [Nevskiales bacterium]